MKIKIETFDETPLLVECTTIEESINEEHCLAIYEGNDDA